MEQLLDADFGDVRVHTDAEAARGAAELKADAYAQGENVYFATGRATFQRPEGVALLAHELTHVRQARRVAGGPGPDPGGTLSEVAAEREALDHEAATRRTLESGASIQRRQQAPAMDLPNLRIQLEDLVDAAQPTRRVSRAVAPYGSSAPAVAQTPVRRAAEQPATTDPTPPAADAGADSGGNDNEVDVAVVASQVYEIIMRRLTLERERIGFH
jgi:hypothetical protein